YCHVEVAGIRFWEYRGQRVLDVCRQQDWSVRLWMHLSPHYEWGVGGSMMDTVPYEPQSGHSDGVADDELAMARRVAGGDRIAFELLMRRHNRRLYRLARAYLRDDSEAMDAMQDAYLNAYKSIGAFRGDSTLFTWLSRLVLNECGLRQRRFARRQNI